MNFETACLSIYSDISTLTSAFSSLNMNSARANASSVLPTPVGPRNINDPIGRFSSAMPALLRLIEDAILDIASSCPTTRFLRSASTRINLFASDSRILLIGIPVQRDTISAISSSVISSFKIRLWLCNLRNFPSSAKSFFSASGIRPYLISATFARSAFLSAISASPRKTSRSFFNCLIAPIVSFSLFQRSSRSPVFSRSSSIFFCAFLIFCLDSASDSFFKASFSISSFIISRLVCSNSSGMLSICKRRDEAASSIKSIALSGRNLSVIYLADKFTAAKIAESVMRIP